MSRRLRNYNSGAFHFPHQTVETGKSQASRAALIICARLGFTPFAQKKGEQHDDDLARKNPRAVTRAHAPQHSPNHPKMTNEEAK